MLVDIRYKIFKRGFFRLWSMLHNCFTFTPSAPSSQGLYLYAQLQSLAKYLFWCFFNSCNLLSNVIFQFSLSHRHIQRINIFHKSFLAFCFEMLFIWTFLNLFCWRPDRRIHRHSHTLKPFYSLQRASGEYPVKISPRLSSKKLPRFYIKIFLHFSHPETVLNLRSFNVRVAKQLIKRRKFVKNCKRKLKTCRSIELQIKSFAENFLQKNNRTEKNRLLKRYLLWKKKW